MIQHGKIVVATDFSYHSNEALRRACTLAEKFGAEVQLVHIFTPTPYFETDELSIQQFPEIDKARHKDAKRMLERQAKILHGSGKAVITTHLKEKTQDTALEICEFARSMNADLIVTGRHSQQGSLEHLFLGSVAERVVRFAKCSVLVAVPHSD